MSAPSVVRRGRLDEILGLVDSALDAVPLASAQAAGQAVGAIDATAMRGSLRLRRVKRCRAADLTSWVGVIALGFVGARQARGSARSAAGGLEATWPGI